MENKTFTSDEDLMTNLMSYFEAMMSDNLPDLSAAGRELRVMLLRIYFNSFLLERFQMTKQQQKFQGTSWRDRKRSIVLQSPLHLMGQEDPFANIHEDSLLVCLGDPKINIETVQNQMNDCNVTKLVNIIKSSPSHSVLMATINLSVALLNNGNQYVQASMWNILCQPDSEPFFTEIHERFQAAQEEIKNSPTGLVIMETEGTTNLVVVQDRKPATGTVTSFDIQDQLSLVAHSNDSLSSRKTSKRESKNENIPTLNVMAGHNVMCTPELKVMQPLLRLLQLFCENHNTDMQNYLRHQKNSKNSKNIILETLQFLDCICGITTGGLVLLSLYIHSENVELIDQCLTTLTEYCQGPCHENQRCIASNESSGIDIVVSLIQTELTALDDHQDMAMKLKKTASQTLLAVMESHQNVDIMERIIFKIGPPDTLVQICCNLYNSGERDDNSENSPHTVGHNIYILAHQLATHNKAINLELEKAKKIPNDPISYYASNTAQIEIVRGDRSLEQIVFPKHEICKHLTSETQSRVRNNTKCDTQGSKVEDYFNHTDSLYEEMLCQQALIGHQVQYWMSRNIVNWSSMSFYLAVIVNIIVLLFYPFDIGSETIKKISSWYVFLITSSLIVLSGILWYVFHNSHYEKRALFTIGTFAIICSLFLFKIKLTLFVLGLLQVIIKCIFLASALGNRGVFTNQLASYKQLLKDGLIVFHSIFLVFCLLGWIVHEFFYAFLLFEIIYREEMLQSVMCSVTRNGLSIILTTTLGIILIYMYSILGYMFFSDDFLIETHPKALMQNEFNGTCYKEDCHDIKSGSLDVYMEPSCQTLLMCLVTILRDGVKSGGGISDAIRKPPSYEPLFFFRVIFDLSFFIMVILIIIQNLIFGVIIDTFATLRAEKNATDDMLQNTCFICGLHRTKFENHTVTFKEHCEKEHNMWHYLYFIVHLRMKEKTELTGPESYVYNQIKGHIENKSASANLEWFPRLRCMSLNIEEPEQEQNEIKELQKQLIETTGLVKTLSHQLGELRDKMNEQRKLIQRKQLHTTLPSSLHRFATVPH